MQTKQVKNHSVCNSSTILNASFTLKAPKIAQNNSAIAIVII